MIINIFPSETNSELRVMQCTCGMTSEIRREFVEGTALAHFQKRHPKVQPAIQTVQVFPWP